MVVARGARRGRGLSTEGWGGSALLARVAPTDPDARLTLFMCFCNGRRKREVESGWSPASLEAWSLVRRARSRPRLLRASKHAHDQPRATREGRAELTAGAPDFPCAAFVHAP